MNIYKFIFVCFILLIDKNALVKYIIIIIIIINVLNTIIALTFPLMKLFQRRMLNRHNSHLFTNVFCLSLINQLEYYFIVNEKFVYDL